jgi:dihydrofolate reductase
MLTESGTRVPTPRNVIVHIASSADGFIARPDGDLEWLTSRPAPRGFYGMEAFTRSIDTKILGRKTYEASGKVRFNSPHHCVLASSTPDQPAAWSAIRHGRQPTCRACGVPAQVL